MKATQVASTDRVQPADNHPRQCDWLPSELREYYETVLCRLPWPGSDGSPLLRTIGLTSSQSGEGVSTVAAQLAATAASGSDHRILLVDANLGRPKLHRTFDCPLSPGLGEVLVRPSCAAAAIRPTAVPNLSVLPAGEAPNRALIDAAELTEALEAIRNGQDLVVFDLPAAGLSSFALRIAGLLDGVILVVEAERIRWEVAQRAKQLLVRANAQLLGAVLNKRREHVPTWLYH